MNRSSCRVVNIYAAICWSSWRDKAHLLRVKIPLYTVLKTKQKKSIRTCLYGALRPGGRNFVKTRHTNLVDEIRNSKICENFVYEASIDNFQIDKHLSLDGVGLKRAWNSPLYRNGIGADQGKTERFDQERVSLHLNEARQGGCIDPRC